MSGTVTSRIRWELDVVDRGGGKRLLTQDRQIRRSLEQTDRQYKKTASTATSVAGRQAAASRRVEQGVRGEGRASVAASREVRRYADAQRLALAAGSRIIAQTSRIETAYRRRSRAAAEASAKERLAARAQQGAGGAAAAGALGGRAIGGAGGLAAAAGLGLGLAAVTGDAVGFEKQMANVQARLLTTGQNMTRLSNFALELGAKTQFSGREAAAAMDELAAQGFSVREIFKTLPGTLSLAAASGTDLASAAAIQTAALRGFGLEASQAGHVADVLAQTTNKSAVDMADLGEMLPYVASVARQTGTSFEQVAAAAGILGNAGIKGSMAGTALRTSMLRLTDPTKKMRDRLKGVGIEASSLAAIPLPKVIGTIAEKIQGLRRGRQIGIVSAVFGKEAAPSVLNLMSKGEKGINRLTRQLTNSRGAAKRAADIMRNTVSGAWDNFTGSVETASVKLTRRFMPAIKDALNASAGGVNKAEGFIENVAPKLGAGLVAGITGKQLEPTLRQPTSRQDRQRFGGRTPPGGGAQDPSRAAQIGQKLGDVARTIGTAAATAGKQLLDAFKPAMPFLENVVLPLLKGISKGLLISIVGAFKVVVPAIKVFATALGFIGRIAKPLKPVFEGIGTVIGLVFAGPILKGVGLLGKLGGVFRIVGVAAKVLLLPIRILVAWWKLLGSAVLKIPAVLGKIGGALTRAGELFSKFPGKIGSVAGRVLGAAGRLVTAAGRGLAKLPARFAVTAYSAGRAVIDKLGGFAGRAASIGGRITGAVIGGVGKIAGRLGGLAKSVGSAFYRFGKGLVSKIVEAVKSAPGAITDAVKSIIPGPLRGALEKAGGAAGKLKFWRRGGRVRRFQGGGMVDALVSPGEELIFPSGASTLVPGPRVAADNTLVSVPDNTAVLTDHGQSLRAQGWPLNSVIANQVPHFAQGGMVRAIGAARGAGFRGKRLITAGAIAGAETGNFTDLIGDEDRGGSYGPWQVNKPSHPSYQHRRMLSDWTYAARAAYKISSGGRNWSPWTTFREGSHRSYMDDATRAIGKLKTGDVKVRLPSRLSFGEALPSRLAAISAGFEAGREGSPLRGTDIFSNITAGARTAFEKRTKTINGIGGRGAGSPALVRYMVRRANTIDSKRYPYSTPGNRSFGIAGPMDCSGGVSKVIGPKLLPSVQASPYFLTWGKAGKGKHLTTYSRGGSGASGHVFMTLNGKGFGTSTSNPGGGAGWFTPSASYTSGFTARHPAGLRAGGIVGSRRRSIVDRLPKRLRNPRVLTEINRHGIMPGLRAGGFVRAFRTGGLANLAEIPMRSNARFRVRLRDFARAIDSLDEITEFILRGKLRDLRADLAKLREGGIRKRERPAARQLRRKIRDTRGELMADAPTFPELGRIENRLARRIRRVARGGETREEKVQLRRLQAAQRVVQVEMGRRLGLVSQAVEKQATVLERARNALSRGLRERGIDEASAAGVAAMRDLTKVQHDQLVKSRERLVRALTRARRLGDRGAVQSIQEQLGELRETIAETYTTWLEQIRAQIAAAAQERVDASQFGLDQAQNALASLETYQRLNRTADTPGGMVERARAIQAQILPALQANQQALMGQFQALNSIGDTAGARQALLAVQSAGTDIAAAMADVADLFREAALKSAQDLVDAATHGSTMASLGQTRIELEQRIAGTFESGAQARADYINNQIIPALNAELAALQAQQAAAIVQGDPVLASQIAEAVAGKQNDLLQAQVDATEQVAENTGQKGFGGTLGFTYGSESLTDALIAAGNGS